MAIPLSESIASSKDLVKRVEATVLQPLTMDMPKPALEFCQAQSKQLSAKAEASSVAKASVKGIVPAKAPSGPPTKAASVVTFAITRRARQGALPPSKKRMRVK